MCLFDSYKVPQLGGKSGAEASSLFRSRGARKQKGAGYFGWW